MGKRSRKRAAARRARPQAAGEHPRRARRRAPASGRARRAQTAPRAPRREAAAGRASIDDRPPPLWGSFPLTELVTLGGIVLMVWGFLSGPGDEGRARIAAGLAIASLGGLELAIREHVTGFRSHTTHARRGRRDRGDRGAGPGRGGRASCRPCWPPGWRPSASAFYWLRELFKRRSGGLSFR